MTDEILERLDQAAGEVESQLLAEFDRIREIETEEPYRSIDPGVRTALDEIIRQLWHELEHSGDTSQLSLRTEGHEEIADRLVVLKKLLDAKVPTAAINRAHQQTVAASRPKTTISQSRSSVENTDTADPASPGLMARLLSLFGFGAPKTETETVPSKTLSDPQPQDRIPVYLEKGVYAASKELAALAGLFQSIGDDRELMEAAMAGKAVFVSRELSDTATMAVEEESGNSPETGKSVFESRDLSTKPTAPDIPTGVARTPEEIRQKLAQSTGTSTGASRFEARELSDTVSQADTVAPVVAEQTETPAAQSPEEIRRKLAERNAASNPASNKGKASFAAKDIEPIAPVPENKAQGSKIPTKPKGKAVFESKDLSEDPPDRK